MAKATSLMFLYVLNDFSKKSERKRYVFFVFAIRSIFWMTIVKCA